MKLFWPANGPGDNITGVNNYKHGYIDAWNYYNYADRADYNISDKWKVYGRIGRYHTTDIYSNPTPNNSPLYQPTGSYRTSSQVSGDAVWAVSARTVVNFHGDWHSLADAYVSPHLAQDGWSQFWPNNPWYQPYQVNSPGVPVYFPSLNIGGNVFGGRGFYWDQRPEGESYSAKISQQRGSHYLKAVASSTDAGWGPVFVSNTTQFNFSSNLTANTFSNPNTLLYGDQWASFLLGSLDPSTEVVGGGVPVPITDFWGMFIQDDWKLSKRITLNLGLRNEYETAWHDSAHLLFLKAMNLSATVPGNTG